MRRLAICLVAFFLLSIANPIIQPPKEIESLIVNGFTDSGSPDDGCNSDSDCSTGEVCIGGSCFAFLGSSFSSTYTCPNDMNAAGMLIVDAELCDRAKMVGEAHNGIVNYMLEAAGDRFPEPSYSAPSALESLYGLDSMIVRVGLDLPPAEQDKGCWVDGYAEPFWMTPCPHGPSLDSSISGSSSEGRDKTFEYRLLPYMPSPPLEPIPIEPVDLVPLGISSGGAGCHVQFGKDGSPGGWVVPCPYGMMSIANAYGNLRPDLLAQAEYLYENNDLEGMSDEERSQAAAMNGVHYLESMDPSQRSQGANTALSAFDLLADYFKFAASPCGVCNDTDWELLNGKIDSVFSSDEYLEASAEVQETVAFMHAVHYASSELWVDYDELGGTTGRQWCWSCIWKVIGDVVGVGGGISASLGDEMSSYSIIAGPAVIGAVGGSIFGVSGGGGEPIVECPLDRALTINWWNCAHFVESVRYLEEGDFGYGTEWAPDAVAPMFAYSDDMDFANPDGSVCGDGICSPGEEAGSAHHCPADCGLVGWQSMYVYDTPYDETTAEEDLEFVNHVGFYGGTSGRAAYLTIGGVTVLLSNWWTCDAVDSSMAQYHPNVEYSCEDYTGGISQRESSSMGALVSITPADVGSVNGGCWVSGYAGLIWINPCPSGSPRDFDTGNPPTGCWVYTIDGPEWREPCIELSWANMPEGDLQGEGCLVDEVQADGSTITVWRYPCPKTGDADADGVIDDWDDCADTAAGVATDSKGCEAEAAIDPSNVPGFTFFAVLTMLVGAAMVSGRRRIGIG